jgi:hypothetical protein
MLAIITSCCPENDTYNAESFIKQKTHFQDQDDSKPDVRHKKSKSPRRPPSSDSDTDSSTDYSSSSEYSYKKKTSKKPKGRKRSKSPVMPKMPEFSGKNDKVSWSSFIDKFKRTA